jgi:large subunit ribosomal protein L17
MLRNLTLSVLRYERVKTTEAKAKEIRRFVDRMINLGKDGSLVARRRALAWLPEPVIVEKVFTDLAVRWPDRGSGYVRITHLGRRVGDSAPQMLLELVPAPEKPTAAAADVAEEPKPRRRLALPRRRAAAKKDESKAETNAKAAARTTATKKKKTAKGAAT